MTPCCLQHLSPWDDCLFGTLVAFTGGLIFTGINILGEEGIVCPRASHYLGPVLTLSEKQVNEDGCSVSIFVFATLIGPLPQDKVKRQCITSWSFLRVAFQKST